MHTRRLAHPPTRRASAIPKEPTPLGRFFLFLPTPFSPNSLSLTPSYSPCHLPLLSALPLTPCHPGSLTRLCLFSRPRMGKSACFAQRSAVFPAVDGQKRLFCPTKARFSRFGIPKWQVLGHGRAFFWVRDPKMPCFGARRRVFLTSGTQNALFWGTERRRGQRQRGRGGNGAQHHNLSCAFILYI